MTAFILTVVLMVMVPLVTSDERKLLEEDRLREGDLLGDINGRAVSEDIHGVSYKRSTTENERGERRAKQNDVTVNVLKEEDRLREEDLLGDVTGRAVTEDIHGVSFKRSTAENERGERDAMRDDVNVPRGHVKMA